MNNPIKKLDTSQDTVRVMNLYGSYEEMGGQYGSILQEELKGALLVLKNPLTI